MVQICCISFVVNLIYFELKCNEVQTVDALNSWSNDNYLKFNPTQCKFMMSRKRGKSAPQHTLFLMGEPIEKVSSFKYLGVTISDDLTWSKHIQTTVCHPKQEELLACYIDNSTTIQVLPYSCIYTKHKLNHIWSMPV